MLKLTYSNLEFRHFSKEEFYLNEKQRTPEPPAFRGGG